MDPEGLSCSVQGDACVQSLRNGMVVGDVTREQLLFGTGETLQPATQPQAVFSTYLGGSAEDRSYSIGFGPDGRIYVTGRTSSLNFPAQSPYQGTYAGGEWDAFVTCMAADGSELYYSTYLGGSSYDNGYGIKVDDEGCAHVAGPTDSADFPVQNAYQSALSGPWDAFLVKLSPQGNSLVYSTYFGGSGDDRCRDLALDSSGRACVTGTTYSEDFPLVSPWQDALAGESDAWFARFSSSGDTLLSSTYIGGSSNELGEGISIDPFGNALLAGTTESADFPLFSPYQGVYGGGTDAYLIKFDPSGSGVQFSTYLGGSAYESGENVSAGVNSIAITGLTESADFPLVNPVQTGISGSSAAFVCRFNNTGTSQIMSTYIGGSQDDYGRDIAVAPDNSLFITGYTSSTDFPVQDPWQGTYAGGGNDGFLLKISSDDSLEYSTFLGGSDNDSSRGIDCMPDGRVVVTGGIFSQDFPTLNPFQGNHGGGVTDCFVTLFQDDLQSVNGDEIFQGSNIDLGVSSNPSPGQLTIFLGVPFQAPVTIGVYDLNGRLVNTVINSETLQTGNYSFVWNRGIIPGGIYILKASAPGFPSALVKLVLI